MSEIEICLHGLQDTQRLAVALASFDELPLLVALSGTLGAGKTQFVRFAAQSLGVPAEEVTSPTYVLWQRYIGQKVIHHFDFYRLASSEEVWDLGIDELLEQSALIFVEWAEKFPVCLPADHLQIRLTPLESALQIRLALIRSTGALSERALTHINKLWNG